LAVRNNRAMHHKPSGKNKSDITHSKNNISPNQVLIGMAVIAAIVLLFLRYGDVSGKAVATINGEKITDAELQLAYDLDVPPLYQKLMSKSGYLNSSMIPQVLLLQEARKQGISYDRAATQTRLDEMLVQNEITIDVITKAIEEKNITMDTYLDILSKKLAIADLLNRTMPYAEPTDKDIEIFYNENKGLLFTQEGKTVPLSEVKEAIAQALQSQQQKAAIDELLNKLRADAKIVIKMKGSEIQSEDAIDSATEDTAAASGSFSSTGSQTCRENGKPIIRLYSTTWCPHCKWVKDTFDKIMKEEVAKGNIAAYHWEMDTGDNTLTEAVETAVPQAEQALAQQYNPSGGVPFYLFGCSYMRTGNAFESENDLVKEESEFRRMISQLQSE